jgi:hypothetical protein
MEIEMAIPQPNYEPIVNDSVLYINNGQLVASEAFPTLLNINDIECRDSTNQGDIVVSTQVGSTLFDTTIQGFNGIDVFPTMASHWYSIYAIGDSLQKNPSGFIGSERLNPIFPSGYDLFRRIGSIYLNSSKNIPFFNQLGNSDYRYYQWDSAVQVLINGNSTFFFLIDITDVGGVPPNTPKIYLNAQYTPTTAGNIFALKAYNGAPVTVPNTCAVVTGALAGVANYTSSIIVAPTAVEPAGDILINYSVTQNTDSLNLFVYGFDDYL